MFQLFRRAFISSISVLGLLAVSAADNIPWPSPDTELNDVDPRLRLGRYVQNVSSNYVAESVVPIVEEYIAPVVETASNNTESIVREFARTNTVLSSGPYVQSDELGPGIENWLDDGGMDYFNDWFPDKLVDELDYMDEENPRYYRVNQPFYFDGDSFQVIANQSTYSHITFTSDGNVLSLSNGWINVCGRVNIVKTNIVDSIWDISRLSGLYLPHSVNVGWNDRKIDLMEVATYDDVTEATKDKRDYGDISYTNDVWFFTYPNNHGDHAGQTVKFVKTGENIWSHNFPDGGSQTIKYEYAFGQWLWNWQGVYSEAASNATEVVFDDDGTKYVAFRGKRFALDTETKGYLPLTGGTLIGDLVATSTGSDAAIIAQESTNDVGVAMGFGYSGLWPMNKENDGWELLGDYCFLFDRNNERWTLSGFAIEKKTLSEETSTLSFEMDVDNHWQLNITNPSETTPGDTEVYTLTLPLTNGTIATTSDLAASRLAVFSSPQPSLAGWTLPEYISALTKYKYDEYNHICYRMSISNEVFVLKAVTNIDLTAAVNIAALKDYEDKVNQGLVPRSSSGQARDKILMLAPDPIESDKRKMGVKRDLRDWENP